MNNADHALAILDHLGAIYGRPAPFNSPIREGVTFAHRGEYEAALNALSRGVGFENGLADWVIRQHLARPGRP
jgi:hypothetical protein